MSADVTKRDHAADGGPHHCVFCVVLSRYARVDDLATVQDRFYVVHGIDGERSRRPKFLVGKVSALREIFSVIAMAASVQLSECTRRAASYASDRPPRVLRRQGIRRNRHPTGTYPI